MNGLSVEVEEALMRAGWWPDRRVDTAAWRAQLEASGFAFHEAAEQFLSEFGGLSVEHGGHGISRAREPFEFDPLLALGEDGRFNEWGDLIGKRIAPLGELDQGKYFLGIDEDGVIYLVADWLARFGAGVSGLDCLVLGVAPESLYDSHPP